jgi:hypothetical protein
LISRRRGRILKEKQESNYSREETYPLAKPFTPFVEEVNEARRKWAVFLVESSKKRVEWTLKRVEDSMET